MKNYIQHRSAKFFCFIIFALVSCSKKQDPVPNSTTVVVTNFSPTSGSAGTVVTITGTGFSETAAANTVSFNGTNAIVNVATATQLIVTVPAGATSGKIAVTSSGNTARSATDFMVTAPAPTFSISSFSPASGTKGTTVAINGSGFSTTVSADSVYFNGSLAIVTNASATQLMVIVPAGAATGKVSLKIGRPSAASTTDFTVLPDPKGTQLIGELRTQPGYNTTDQYTFVFNGTNQLDSISDVNTSGTGAYTSTGKFLRDANENLVQITNGEGSYLELFYDNAHKLVKVQTISSDNKTITDSITYQYFTDRYERTEIQNPSTTFAATFKYISYYTADGKNIAAQKNYNGAGTLIYSATYTYDDKTSINKLKGIDFMGLFSTDPGGTATDFVNTNNIKDITELVIYAGTPVTVHYSYNYNSDGYVISSMWWTNNNPPIVSSVYQYK